MFRICDDVSDETVYTLLQIQKLSVFGNMVEDVVIERINYHLYLCFCKETVFKDRIS